jgi:chitinase
VLMPFSTLRHSTQDGAMGWLASPATNEYCNTGASPKSAGGAEIVVGVRFVATGWTGVPSANNGLYQDHGPAAPGSWGEPGSIGFQDIEDVYLPTYTRSWENDAQVPWLYNPDTGIMISYEDQESVTAKANYVLANQLGGIMIWELAADDSEDTLVNALAAVLA